MPSEPEIERCCDRSLPRHVQCHEMPPARPVGKLFAQNSVGMLGPFKGIRPIKLRTGRFEPHVGPECDRAASPDICEDRLYRLPHKADRPEFARSDAGRSAMQAVKLRRQEGKSSVRGWP